MQKRSNSVDLFTKKVMDYMTDDYICVHPQETIGKATQQLRNEKKSTLIILIMAFVMVLFSGAERIENHLLRWRPKKRTS